jgi:hypothetical protein
MFVPLGVTMLLVAIALPFVGDYAGDAYVRQVMVTDPVPQNAMLLAFVGWCASIVAGIVLGVIAVVLIVLGSIGVRPAI